MTLRYDSQWRSMAGCSLEEQGEVLGVGDVVTRRNRYTALFSRYPFTTPEDIELQVFKTPTSDGYEVSIFHLSSRKNQRQPGLLTPAVLHIHDGGFVAVKASNVLGSLVPFFRETGVPIFSVDYRWAPENPFPTPIEDFWDGLQYLYLHADALSIARNRIAIMGESAGGGLAAELIIMARDRKLSPPLAKQILIYSMLDDRTVTDHSGGMAVFSLNDVYTGWKAYLGEAYNTENVPPCAAPARVMEVEGLPELYLDVGQLDIFLPEDLAYVTKFLAAGIQTEFHVYPGEIHAFQRWSAESHVVKQAFINRLRAISTL